MLVLGFLTAGVPAVTHAGMLECASHSISARDLASATAVARRVAGSSRLARSGRRVCMNPDRGRVWYEAVPEPQPDGSIVQPHILCTRERGPWGCEVLKDRTADIDVQHDGAKLTLKFQLPVDLDLGDARKIVAHAFEIAPSLLNSQECGWEPDPGNPDEGAKKAFKAGDFDPAKTTYWKEIQPRPDGNLAVIFDGNGIEFSHSPGGPNWNFSCWNVWIVLAQVAPERTQLARSETYRLWNPSSRAPIVRP